MPDALPARRICVVVNPDSGSVKRRPDALAVLEETLGRTAELRKAPSGALVGAAQRACDDGADMLVAAGGDGSIMALAGVAIERDVPLGVLPLGTFNYFARGNAIPEEIEDAVQVLERGRETRVTVGEVNGQIFLNNASLGVYPLILKSREETYRRLGRHRLAAHWSVLKTFARSQRLMRLSLENGHEARMLHTPLLFVARSAHQLETFGLTGPDCIREDRFAVFSSPEGDSRGLFRRAWKLVRRRMRPGVDFEMYCLDDFSIGSPRRRVLVACDGEKFRLATPLRFRVRRDALRLVVPTSEAA